MSTENPGNITNRAFIMAQGAECLALFAPEGAIIQELDRKEVAYADDADDTTLATLLLAGVRSQGDYAAVVINVFNGRVDPEVLTQALANAFPGARIGKRHGPHYLSHARSKKLRGLRKGLNIPFVAKTRKEKPKVKAEEKKTTPEPIPTVEELIEAHKGREGRRKLQELAKGLGISAGGKSVDIAARIVEAKAAA